jgi:hypothetical protein
MHLVTYLHPRLPTDSAEEPKLFMQKPNRTMLTENIVVWSCLILFLLSSNTSVKKYTRLTEYPVTMGKIMMTACRK